MTQSSNPTADRARKIANASPKQREAALADYEDYKRRLVAIHQVAESFEFYFAEWLTVAEIKLDAGEEPDGYGARDYSPYYGGRGAK